MMQGLVLSFSRAFAKISDTKRRLCRCQVSKNDGGFYGVWLDNTIENCRMHNASMVCAATR